MQLNKTMKYVLACVVGVTVAISVYAKNEGNKGITFYDDNDTAEKNAPRSVQKTVNGVSFNIAETKDPKKIDWMKRAENGSAGNVTCYVDAKGSPTAVFVLGVAPVSQALGGVEARNIAHMQAEMYAKGAFALWMKEFFSVENILEQKTIVIKTGNEKGRDSHKENAETETKVSQKYTQMANGQWRGMSLYASANEGGQYVAIWRWSVKESELARMVEMLTRDGSVDGTRKLNWDVKEHKLTFREDN